MYTWTRLNVLAQAVLAQLNPTCAVLFADTSPQGKFESQHRGIRFASNYPRHVSDATRRMQSRR